MHPIDQQLAKFGEITVLCIGDLMLDHFVYGDVSRVSPEAPSLVIAATREERLLAFLAEPRTLADVVEHRLVYRPHVDAPHVPTVERRTAEQHLARLVGAGRVTVTEEGRYRAVG